MQGVSPGAESQFSKYLDDNQLQVPKQQTTTGFDFCTLLAITEDILYQSSDIIDDLLLKKLPHDVVPIGDHGSRFISPLCELKSIGYEMSLSCEADRAADEMIMIESRVQTIFRKLSKYSCKEKAVLVMAALAAEYGDFWILSRLYGQSNQISNSLAILKQVPVLLNLKKSHKRRQYIFRLNDLIMAALKVMKCIFDVEKFSTECNPKDVPTLASAMHDIRENAYWTILTIVACATKFVTHLTSEEDKSQDLLMELSKKMELIFGNIGTQIRSCIKEREMTKTYLEFWNVLDYQTAPKISDFFYRLLLSNGDAQLPVVTVGSTNLGGFDINELEGKYVLFYISSLDNVSAGSEVSILRQAFEGKEKTQLENCKIIWIPIVYDWSEGGREEQYAKLRSEMPAGWAVKYISAAATRYIQEKWNFKNYPIAVLMNPQGKLENTNALHLIRKHRQKFLDFISISNVNRWIAPVLRDISPKVDAWVKGEKYIFFYAGRDEELVRRFQRTAAAAKIAFAKQLQISVELFRVGQVEKLGQDQTMVSRFWSGIKFLCSTLAHSDNRLTEYKAARKEVYKLVSYKRERVWAMLCKGSTVVASGRGLTISKVLEEFDTWKELVSEQVSFEICFQKECEKVISVIEKQRPSCCSLEISGDAPKTVDCPICAEAMETELVSYKCCHPRIRN